METTERGDERQLVADFVQRIRNGEEMADIFGVGEETVARLEAQMYRLYRNGQFDQAKVAGRGILALDDERVFVRLLMGDIALEEYRFSKAVEHLECAHRSHPDQMLVRARLGEALIQSGRPDRGRRHLETVVERDGELDDENRQRCRALLRSITPKE